MSTTTWFSHSFGLLMYLPKLGTVRPNALGVNFLIQRRTGARVVKAFNLCHAEVWTMRPPVFDGRPLAVPYSGDDPAAKEVVAQLIREMGADPIDLGPLYHSKDLEGMGTLMITLLFGGLARARSSTW